MQPVQPVPQVRHIHVPVAQPVQPDLHIHVPVQRDLPVIHINIPENPPVIHVDVQPKDIVQPQQPVVTEPPKQVQPEVPKPTDTTTDEEDNNCIICFDAVKNAVYVPCGHVCCCLQCANDYFNSKKSCPMCRQAVIMVVKCHFS